MSDFSAASNKKTDTYPVNAKETSGLLKRVEPLINAKQVKSRFLKGINLTLPNGDVITDDDIKDRVNMAINDIEVALKIPIIAEIFEDRLPFDKDAYKSFIFTKTKQKPIQSVLDFKVETTDGQNIFKIPSQWIDTGRFNRGQINVIPFMATYAGNYIAGYSGNAGLIMLASMGGVHWIPGYWTVTYSAGLSKDAGQVPVSVNNLIGIEAALMILSEIGPTREFNSVSLGQDGISQSSSGPGNALFAQRTQELQQKKAELMGQLKGLFGSKWIIGDF